MRRITVSSAGGLTCLPQVHLCSIYARKSGRQVGFVLQNDITRARARSRSLWLFGRFKSLAFAQAHAGATAVLVDEFDTSDLERTSYDLKGSSTRLTGPSLKLVHCYDAHARALGQFLLAPCKEAARSPGA
jgi:hypothetical protein